MQRVILELIGPVELYAGCWGFRDAPERCSPALKELAVHRGGTDFRELITVVVVWLHVSVWVVWEAEAKAVVDEEEIYWR